MSTLFLHLESFYTPFLYVYKRAAAPTAAATARPLSPIAEAAPPAACDAAGDEADDAAEPWVMAPGAPVEVGHGAVERPETAASACALKSPFMPLILPSAPPLSQTHKKRAL